MVIIGQEKIIKKSQQKKFQKAERATIIELNK